MTIRLVRRVLTAVLTAGLLVAIASPSHAQFVDYDDFSSGVIDAEKIDSLDHLRAASTQSSSSRRRDESGERMHP